MLTFRGVRKTFDRIVALDDLSLEIRTGEIFGLLGPNGAGKTTLIGIAVGLLAAEAGAVLYDGAEIAGRTSARSSLGVAPQSLALYDDLTGEENLRFFARLHGLSGHRLSERVEWTLGFAGLADRRKDRVGTYSGGMKRRLNLAAALLHDPRILLLDEPTVGVDPQSRNAIFDSIEALHGQGKTIVYTTHYMEEAERLCDRVGIIDHGKLLALDTVDALLARYGGKSRVVVRTAGREKRIETDDPIAEIVRLEPGDRAASIRVEHPDLESVFLNLTGRTLRD